MPPGLLPARAPPSATGRPPATAAPAPVGASVFARLTRSDLPSAPSGFSVRIKDPSRIPTASHRILTGSLNDPFRMPSDPVGKLCSCVGRVGRPRAFHTSGVSPPFGGGVSRYFSFVLGGVGIRCFVDMAGLTRLRSLQRTSTPHSPTTPPPFTWRGGVRHHRLRYGGGRYKH